MNTPVGLTLLSKRGQKIMRVLLAIFWLMPLSVFCLIVLLAPLDALDRWPGAQAFCEQIQTWDSGYWPSSGPFAHVRGSAFPQVARLATAWAVAAWIPMTTFTLLLCGVFQKNLREGALSPETATQKLKWIASTLIIVPLCIYSFFCLPGDPSFAKGLTTQSRVGYAFMGTLAIAFSSWGLAYLPLLIVSFFIDPASGRKTNR